MEEYQSMLTTLIQQKKAADVTLEEEVSRNWAEITSREYLFDRPNKDVEQLEKLMESKDNLLKILANLVKEGKECRKLGVQILGNSKLDQDEDEANNDDENPDKVFVVEHLDDGKKSFIKDSKEFANKLEMYPTHHITK